MSEELDLIERLKAIRKAITMNQRDLAKKLEISCTSISEMEKGKYKPNFDFMYKLVKEYRVNLNYLMFGEGEMFMGEKPVSNNGGYAANSEDVKWLFHHFERSPLVQYYLLSTYTTFYHKEKEIIDLQLEEYEKKFKK